jgi:hypothetical protein
VWLDFGWYLFVEPEWLRTLDRRQRLSAASRQVYLEALPAAIVRNVLRGIDHVIGDRALAAELLPIGIQHDPVISMIRYWYPQSGIRLRGMEVKREYQEPSSKNELAGIFVKSQLLD